MIEITSDIYRMVAARLKEEIGTAEWFNGSVEGEALFPATDKGEAITPASTVDGVSETVNEASATTIGEPAAAIEWRLTLTAVIYRRTETMPEGIRRPVSDVVPVWWEFSTVSGNDGDDYADQTGCRSVDRAAHHVSASDCRPDGLRLNNFSFTELKPYLIDYD